MAWKPRAMIKTVRQQGGKGSPSTSIHCWTDSHLSGVGLSGRYFSTLFITMFTTPIIRLLAFSIVVLTPKGISSPLAAKINSGGILIWGISLIDLLNLDRLSATFPNGKCTLERNWLKENICP